MVLMEEDDLQMKLLFRINTTSIFFFCDYS